MHHSSILPAAVAGALVLGCAGDSTQPSAAIGAPAAAVVGNARTLTINELVNDCTGDQIPLTGTIHESSA